MKLVNDLFNKFMENDGSTILIIIFCNLVLSIIQINGVSYATANLIESVENGNKKNIYHFFYIFIFIAILFNLFVHITRYFQSYITAKIQQWVRFEFFKIIFSSNNENLSNINFGKFNAPISRFATTCLYSLYSITSTIIPNLSVLFIISCYFLYKNLFLGIFFIICNLLLFLYIYAIWDDTVKEKIEYEKLILSTETLMVDNLANFDKIIYRGQIDNEIAKYEKNTKRVIEASTNYNRHINAITLKMTLFIYFIFLFSISYLIQLKVTKKMTALLFITLLSIITMYRDKMISVINDFSEFVDFFGRTKQVLRIFDELSDVVNGHINKKYTSIELPFDKVVYKNVDFRYKNTDVDIFKNLNITLNLKNKIIGVTGLSGNGKSTFVKLLLKLYRCDAGTIYIDNTDISEVDPIYIRKNIIYVNQNSKLFDKKIIENILYGCPDEDTCKKYFDEVMRYPKIVELYQNVDLYEKNAGMGGENLSGGQRQIINIINGIINPAPILVIDEPTNALDGELKKELIGLIKDMKKYKKCIIIITHDRDVYPLFNETIPM